MEHETQATESEKLLFKHQNQEVSIKLTNEQLDYLIQLCKYDIEMNEDLITDLKDMKEIDVWKDEIKFVRNIISKIRGLRAEIKHNQFVLQALTPQQEDYIIESGLEQARERRENDR